MAPNPLVSAIVNAYAGALVSVSQTMGMTLTFQKSEIASGVNAPGSRAAALIGIVGSGIHGTAALMADMEGFSSFVRALSGGMIAPDPEDPMAMSVLGEVTNMTSGQALMKLDATGLDITPPQLISGENIKAIPPRKPDVKSFTLPFIVESGGGRLYLILSVHE
jgi:chemotaxis protein CheX